ncbi:MAG: D-aminoacylase [Candidatus Marinimicrobia bacterium]|nr:D-aminoacylase [Candidatus Neomarinimicrobiota bacterium]MBL7009810.1 D-aminoacylase [Candidatus Neomarinimicrobiota bacterium]MBL7029951.1 D-aminoacylase [Candidatus Neomarinimicrobiota bacterium]
MKYIIPFFLCFMISCATPTYDIIIKNGKVFDGSGSAFFISNIYIRDGKIAYVGNQPKAVAPQIIDATGLVIAPGFIDMHTHSERKSLDFSPVENYLQQGVTTMVGGNCGSSPFPIGDFFAKTDSTGIGPNLALLVGHNTIRRKVMGTENRLATETEIKEMQSLVHSAMEDGAFGMSTGLKYIPGAYSNLDEVVALASVVSKNDGFYATHMREEGIGLLESVEEAINIGRQSNLPVQISHHKAVGKSMWGQSIKTLEMVDNARKKGLEITLDQYPYTATSTTLKVVFPAWSLAGGHEKLKERLDDPKQRQKIKDGIVWNIVYDRGGGDPASIVVASYPTEPSLNGLNLAEITQSKGFKPTAENAAEVLMDMVYAGNGSGIYHCLNEDDVRRIMAHPQVMHASDGSTIQFNHALPHPRNYGTFPRVLGKYVRDLNVISLEEAIRKMTSFPASILGLSNRGKIKNDFWADLVVFNPKTIMDMATWDKPHQYPSGISWVIVNGKVAIDHGEWTNILSGKVLKRHE